MSGLRTAIWQALLLRYGGAFLAIAAAIPLRVLVDAWIGDTGFAVFLAAALVAAWVGGLGPALLFQTILLIVAIIWFNDSQPKPSPERAIAGVLAYYFVGAIVGVLSEAVDAARQRAIARAAEAAAQREWLRTTLACLGDGVLAADPAGNVVMLNHAAERMTGWSLPEALGQPVARVLQVQAAAGAATADPVQRSLAEVQPHTTGGLMLTTAHGRRLPIAYHAAPIVDSDQRTIGVVIVFRDETERQRTEETLRLADRRKDEFLATLAHELRNPLAPIRTGLEVLKLTPDPAASEEIRAMIERQTAQMVRLVDDLLDISRITWGKLRLRKAPVELAEIVRNAVEASQPFIAAARHDFAVSLPERPVRLVADGSRLTQVLSNLLHNAAKYTPPGGRIALSAAVDAGDVVLEVRDTGRGIPPEMTEQIFEMFTQVPNIQGSQEGLGIGLTLAKWVVEFHAGTIHVASAGPNLGSRFVIRLPLEQEEPAGLEVPSSRPLPPPSSGEGVCRRVLVVDDSRDARDMLGLMIRRLGHEVRVAGDGLEAVDVARDWLPNIVLMDLGMPRLDGWGAARLIRSLPRGQELQLIAITGWGQEEDQRRTKEAGFDHHLVKPVEFAALQQLFKFPPVANGSVALQLEVAATP